MAPSISCLSLSVVSGRDFIFTLKWFLVKGPGEVNTFSEEERGHQRGKGDCQRQVNHLLVPLVPPSVGGLLFLFLSPVSTSPSAVNQDSSVFVMAASRKLDFLDIFIFDMDEEENEPLDQVAQDVPLVDLTSDSDDEPQQANNAAANEATGQGEEQEKRVEQPDQSDGNKDEDTETEIEDEESSEEATGMIQQEEQQTSMGHQRKLQPGRLREPTDSEDEDEGEDEDGESCEDEDDSSSSSDEDEAPLRKQSERTLKRTRPRKDWGWSLKAISFAQLKSKNKKGAQRVLHYYKYDKQSGRVHVCSRFIRGKCGYMCKFSRHLYSHMKNNHPDDKHPGYKIFNYPGSRDYKVVTKPYNELK